MKLIQQIQKIQNSSTKPKINQRLKEFEEFQKKSTQEWFSELCFCILTANSKALTAINIQNELGAKGFCGYCQKDLSQTIKNNKHRFHNNKAKYITQARCYIDIKTVVQSIIKKNGENEAREWLVKNVQGLGYKEASHFLRNVGYKNLAILDRHIINLMKEEGLLKEKPKTLNKKNYLEIEEAFKNIAEQANMNFAELDLYMWFIKTGKILK